MTTAAHREGWRVVSPDDGPTIDPELTDTGTRRRQATFSPGASPESLPER